MAIPTSTAKYDLNNVASYSGTGNTLYDLGVNNYDITLSNTTYTTQALYNALVFNKATSSKGTYVGSMGLGTTTPIFSFAMWVKPTDLVSGVNYGWFLSYGKESGAVGGAPMILGEYAGSNNLSISFGSGISLYQSGTALTLGEWYFLTSTCDGTDHKLYLNGAFLGSVAVGAGDIITPEELAIAYLTGTGVGYISFELNYLEIFNTALTAGQVTELYDNTANRFGANLLVEYDFSNASCYPGTGNTVFDLSGNGINASIGSSLTFNSAGSQSSFIFNGNYPNSQIEASFNPASKTVWTFNTWIYPTTEQPISIMFAGDTGNGSGPYTFYNGNGPFSNSFLSSNGFGTGTINASAYSFPKNNWIMVTYSSDGTTLKLYANGSGIGTASASGVALPAGSIPLRIGRNSDTTYVFEGNIAIAEFYKTALSASDITDIYNGTVSRFNPAPPAPVLIGSYDFSDPACYPGTGNTAFDLTANNNDLIMNGSGATPSYGGTGQSKYFSFSNSNTNYLYCSQFSALGTTFGGDNFTLSAWHYYDNVQQDNAAILFGGNGANNDGVTIQVTGNDGNKIYGGIFGDVPAVGIANTANTWHMSTYTGDGTTIKIYQDGALIGSTSQNGDWNGRGFVLGRYLDASYNPVGTGNQLRYEGLIGIAEVYSGALGSTDISNLYATQEPRFYPSPPAPYQGIAGGRQFAQGFNG